MEDIRILEHTVEDVYNALDKNGFHYVRERWFEFDGKGNYTGGCVLGQAALNLDVAGVSDAENEWDEFVDLEDIQFAYAVQFKGKKYDSEDYDEDDKPRTIIASQEVAKAAIATKTDLTIESQLNRFKVGQKKWFIEDEEDYERSGCGSAIVWWNDAHPLDKDGDPDETKWRLPTYEDVRKMAYSILKPHFARKVYLIQVDRKVVPLVIGKAI